jgi:hypothetical protein
VLLDHSGLPATHQALRTIAIFAAGSDDGHTVFGVLDIGSVVLVSYSWSDDMILS